MINDIVTLNNMNEIGINNRSYFRYIIYKNSEWEIKFVIID